MAVERIDHRDAQNFGEIGDWYRAHIARVFPLNTSSETAVAG